MKIYATDLFIVGDPLSFHSAKWSFAIRGLHP